MLENLRYAIDGARDGMAWREDREARAAATERQAMLDQQNQADYQRQISEHEQDRAIEASDREEFGLPEKRDQASKRKEERERAALVTNFGRAIAKAKRDNDMSGFDEIYRTSVPDGFESQSSIEPDGRVKIVHSNGTVYAKDVDEYVFGKEDGSGGGFVDILFPEGIPDRVAGEREKKRARATELEDEERKNDFRMREIGAMRAPTPTQSYGSDADGNPMLFSGATATPVRGPDGQPVRGGVGKNSQYAMTPYQMAEFERKNGAEQQKAVASALKQASEELRGKGNPEQVEKRAREILSARERITQPPEYSGNFYVNGIDDQQPDAASYPGAKQASDGNWYVQQNGQWMRVE